MKLTIKHLLGLEKLPRPCAVGLDESSSMVDIDVYKDDEADRGLTNNTRFYNHNIGDNALFILMEQNLARAYKAFRDSVQEITTHLGVKILLKPKRLERRLKRVKERFRENAYVFRIPILGNLFEFCPFIWHFRKGKYQTDDYAVYLLNLEKKVGKIGVFQLHLKVNNGRDDPRKLCKEYIPLDLPFYYPNRFFRTGYLANGLTLEKSEFEHEYQSKDSVEDYLLMGSVLDDECKPRKGAVHRGCLVRDLLEEVKKSA